MTDNAVSEDLSKAIQDNDLVKARTILGIQDGDHSCSIDVQDSDGWSALMFAVQQNDVEITQEIIKRRSEFHINPLKALSKLHYFLICPPVRLVWIVFRFI